MTNDVLDLSPPGRVAKEPWGLEWFQYAPPPSKTSLIYINYFFFIIL